MIDAEGHMDVAAVAMIIGAIFLPVVAGVIAYRRSGLEPLLTIPLATILVPLAWAVLYIPIYLLVTESPPRWLFSLPSVVLTLVLVGSIRRLERELA